MLAADLKDESGKVAYKRGFLITKEEAHNIEGAGFAEVFVRSPLTCKTVHGLCQMCYGLDLGRNHLVNKGEAVGIIAAQAIGEPGTQLTLRNLPPGRRRGHGYHHRSASYRGNLRAPASRRLQPWSLRPTAKSTKCAPRTPARKS